MVVDVRVQDQIADEFSGDGVDDADVQVLDEQDHAGSLVGSADADVVQSAVVAQRHGACFVDGVVADPVVGLGVAGVESQDITDGRTQYSWVRPSFV